MLTYPQWTVEKPRKTLEISTTTKSVDSANLVNIWFMNVPNYASTEKN